MFTICNLQVFSKHKMTAQEYGSAIVKFLKSNDRYNALLLIEQFKKDYPSNGNPYFFYAAMDFPENCQSVLENTSIALSLGIDTESSATAKLMRGSCYFQQSAGASALHELDLIKNDEYKYLSAAEKSIYYTIKAHCLFFIKEDYEGTVYNATRALEYSVSPDLYFYRGMAYMTLRELEKAKIDFKRQKALCLEPIYKDSPACELIIELN